MINLWLGMHLEWQIAVVASIGVLLGPCVNWMIYNVAYFPRPISPWRRQRFHAYIENERDLAKLIENSSKIGEKHVPVFGWLFLRSESAIQGTLFWLRPFLIELLLPILLAWLFWYEVTGGLLPVRALPMLGALQPTLHIQFIAHALLCLLMCVATFIDFDERTIPDSVTIPGTFIGLIGATCFPNWHLYIAMNDPVTNAWPSNLHYDSPWSGTTLSGSSGLFVGLGCFAVWCFALADRRWISRRGLRKAIRYFFAGLVRFPTWKYLLAMWAVGSALVAMAWSMSGPASQQSLLSSLIGIVLGGLTVWLVRCVAGFAIGMEALGFGDVTLMAMVGAFVGWQTAAIAFFVAPMIALLFVLVRYLVTGDNQTPFGPYLCVGTLVVILFWDEVWNGYCQDMLAVMGPVLIPFLVAAFLMMGGLLWAWRLIKGLVFK